MEKKKAVMVLSGGLDSTTLMYRLIKEGYEVFAISFNYGQKHTKELTYASATCLKLGVDHKVIDVSFLKGMLNSALTNDEDEIPEGHYEEDNMKATVVPNRNMIFTSMAVGYGLSIGAEIVASGVHDGDHAIYPDCRRDFRKDFNGLVEKCDWNKISLYTPYHGADKGDIVRDGIKNGVDYGLTWTCYKGLDKACGKCGSCCERIISFDDNNMIDPLEYEGGWALALQEAKNVAKKV